jgi:hypothetical protein
MQLSIPTFIIIGAAGDGKSSLVEKLMPEEEGAQERPEIGKMPEGVTKDIRPFAISCNGEEMILLDTMGIGDMDKGISQLIAGVRSVLENVDKVHGAKIDGIIVTSPAASARLGMACQIVQKIIDHGLLKESAGISPWKRVLICGTQRDRCDEEDISHFKTVTGKHFFEGKVEPAEWQVTTCSTKQEDGMNDLMQCMQSMIGSGHHIGWDAGFDNDDLAAGLCAVMGGSVDLQRLQLLMEFAWTEVQSERRNTDLLSGSATTVAQQVTMAPAASKLEAVIAEHAGNKFITQEYAQQQAETGLGGGVIKGAERLAIQAGNEALVGKKC